MKNKRNNTNNKTTNRKNTTTITNKTFIHAHSYVYKHTNKRNKRIEKQASKQMNRLRVDPNLLNSENQSKRRKFRLQVVTHQY